MAPSGLATMKFCPRYVEVSAIAAAETFLQFARQVAVPGRGHHTAGGLGGGAAGLGAAGLAAGAAAFTGGLAASPCAGGGPSEPSVFCSSGMQYPRGNPTLTICAGEVSNGEESRQPSAFQPSAKPQRGLLRGTGRAYQKARDTLNTPAERRSCSCALRAAMTWSRSIEPILHNRRRRATVCRGTTRTFHSRDSRQSSHYGPLLA